MIAQMPGALKTCLVLFILLIAMFLYAEDPQTIVGTIYTENTLQGGIGYHVQNGTYYGGILPSGEYFFQVGDGYDPNGDFNDICLRSYVSFPIQPIPTNYLIDSVYIMVFQIMNQGNDQWGFPNWYENQYYPCSLFHVNYGMTFEPDDFSPQVYDSLGVISSNDSISWKTLNITSAYLNDMSNNRTYCQLMFKFPILTDFDQMGDFISFYSSYETDCTPHINISYSSTSTNQDEVSVLDNAVYAYPNPCNDFVAIAVKGDANIISADLYNLKGQKIESTKISKNSTKEVRLSIGKEVKPGLYIVKNKLTIRGKTTIVTKKLLIR